MALDRQLNSPGHVHRFMVVDQPSGWDVREEEDASVIRHTHRDDWHRVERDIRLFDLTALALKRQGWTES